jgi:hypothetical protein
MLGLLLILGLRLMLVRLLLRRSVGTTKGDVGGGESKRHRQNFFAKGVRKYQGGKGKD